MAKQHTNPSLVVIGTGIKFLAHLTTEARAYIEQSDKVLFLVNEPAMQRWIKAHSKSAESLAPIYFSHSRRCESYQAITQYILDQLQDGQTICVALYGHPAVFAQPALDAVRIAKAQQIYAKILPAVSAEDCLFADLVIDPGSCGCQSFEATDFMLYERRFDTSSHLILWQPGMIAAVGFEPVNQPNGIAILTQYLLKFYPAEHSVIVYEAAQYPGFEAKITEIPLHALAGINLTTLHTLYVPPLANRTQSKEAILRLNLGS